MKVMPWPVYRVRRYFSAPAPASAIRSLERILVADRLLVQAALEEISDLVGVTLVKNVEITGAPVRGGDRDSHRRLWLRKRIDGVYLAMEEFYVAAPAQAVDKALDSFTATWIDNTDKLLSAMERRTDAAIAQRAPGDQPRRQRHRVWFCLSDATALLRDSRPHPVRRRGLYW